MLNLEQATKQDRLLRALTGMNQKAFESLLLVFTEVYEQYRKQKPRKRATGGGRKAILKTNSSKLFFILFYFKCYPTFDLAGFIFGFDRSQAHYWVHQCGSEASQSSSYDDLRYALHQFWKQH